MSSTNKNIMEDILKRFSPGSSSSSRNDITADELVGLIEEMMNFVCKHAELTIKEKDYMISIRNIFLIHSACEVLASWIEFPLATAIGIFPPLSMNKEISEEGFLFNIRSPPKSLKLPQAMLYAGYKAFDSFPDGFDHRMYLIDKLIQTFNLVLQSETLYPVISPHRTMSDLILCHIIKFKVDTIKQDEKAQQLLFNPTIITNEILNKRLKVDSTPDIVEGLLVLMKMSRSICMITIIDPSKEPKASQDIIKANIKSAKLKSMVMGKIVGDMLSACLQRSDGVVSITSAMLKPYVTSELTEREFQHISRIITTSPSTNDVDNYIKNIGNQIIELFVGTTDASDGRFRKVCLAVINDFSMKYPKQTQQYILDSMLSILSLKSPYFGEKNIDTEQVSSSSSSSSVLIQEIDDSGKEINEKELLQTIRNLRILFNTSFGVINPTLMNLLITPYIENLLVLFSDSLASKDATSVMARHSGELKEIIKLFINECDVEIAAVIFHEFICSSNFQTIEQHIQCIHHILHLKQTGENIKQTTSEAKTTLILRDVFRLTLDTVGAGFASEEGSDLSNIVRFQNSIQFLDAIVGDYQRSLDLIFSNEGSDNDDGDTVHEKSIEIVEKEVVYLCQTLVSIIEKLTSRLDDKAAKDTATEQWINSFELSPLISQICSHVVESLFPSHIKELKHVDIQKNRKSKFLGLLGPLENLSQSVSDLFNQDKYLKKKSTSDIKLYEDSSNNRNKEWSERVKEIVEQVTESSLKVRTLLLSTSVKEKEESASAIGEATKTSESSIKDISTIQNQKVQKGLQKALSNIESKEAALRAMGVDQIRDICLKDDIPLDIIESIYDVIITETIQDNDPYVYLTSVRALSNIADKKGQTAITIEKIINAIMKDVDSTDIKTLSSAKGIFQKVRLGESLLYIVRRCGDTLPRYAEMLVPCLIYCIRETSISTLKSSIHDSDDSLTLRNIFRASCLVLLGEICEIAPFVALKYSQDVLSIITGIKNSPSEKDERVLRANEELSKGLAIEMNI